MDHHFHLTLSNSDKIFRPTAIECVNREKRPFNNYCAVHLSSTVREVMAVRLVVKMDGTTVRQLLHVEPDHGRAFDPKILAVSVTLYVHSSDSVVLYLESFALLAMVVH